jgi:hypothetical protein
MISAPRVSGSALVSVLGNSTPLPPAGRVKGGSALPAKATPVTSTRTAGIITKMLERLVVGPAPRASPDIAPTVSNFSEKDLYSEIAATTSVGAADLTRRCSSTDGGSRCSQFSGSSFASCCAALR